MRKPPLLLPVRRVKFWPAATVNATITPEYLGVGYIIGPKIGGVLVAGSILAWWAIIWQIGAGALSGVIVALLSLDESIYDSLQYVNTEEGLTSLLGQGGYYVRGVLFFAAMAGYLYRTATR